MFLLLKDFGGNPDNGQTNVDIGKGFKASSKHNHPGQGDLSFIDLILI